MGAFRGLGVQGFGVEGFLPGRSSCTQAPMNGTARAPRASQGKPKKKPTAAKDKP